MVSKITHVDIIPVSIKLTESFVIAKGPLDYASITVIKIYTDQGMFGIGECCPYRTIHGETQAGSIQEARQIAQLILGKDPSQIRRIVKIMDGLISGHASIKAAFDMALYDLNAKMAEIPLYQYLNGDPSKDIYTGMTISLLEKDEMIKAALRYKERGFPALKIKLGSRPSTQDVSRVEGIRQAVGQDLHISIDANQGWDYVGAKAALEQMADLHIRYCEAPIHSENHHHLRALRRSSPIPIMGDESVFDHKNAFQRLADHSIDLVNIKIGKSGGITNAMKIAAIAESCDVACQVGCFSESRLGITALVHFTMAWDHIIYFDLDAPLMHSEDPIIGGITYDSDWHVSTSDDPGLGADYDPAFLNRFDHLTIK